MIIRIAPYRYDDHSGISYWFWCPGCETAHRINETWGFNDNPDSPTFTPSILVNGFSQCPPGTRCHSFITDGMIRFLDDCDHELAGQTVPLPELPQWLADGN